MATRTQGRASSTNNGETRKPRGRPRSAEKSSSSEASSSRASSSSSSDSNRRDRSAFSWGDNAGPLLGAALAGAAIGFAANYGRKALMQGLEATAGDWDEILAAEHDLALSIF